MPAGNVTTFIRGLCGLPFIACWCLSAQAQSITYKDAYEKHQLLERPLIVLITTESCAPCKVIKNELLARKLEFVEVNKSDPLATQFVIKPTAPTIVAFHKGIKLVQVAPKKIVEFLERLK